MIFNFAGSVNTVLPTSVLDWLRDPEALLKSMGPYVLVLVAVIVFIESGVLFPFLPGDSMIFTAGLLHSQLNISLWQLIAVIILAGFLGDQVGYWLGRDFGRKLFKPDARILRTERLVAAEKFFNHYGGRALVLARFVPFARTYTPLAAGIARYEYPKFLKWNLIGAVGWGGGLTYLGSLLGGIAFIRNNIEALAVVIVIASLLPMIVEAILQKRRNKRANDATESEESSSIDDEADLKD